MKTKKDKIESALVKWGYTKKTDSRYQDSPYWECTLGHRGTIQVDLDSSIESLTIHVLSNSTPSRVQTHTMLFKSLKGVHFPSTSRWLSRQLQKAYLESPLSETSYKGDYVW